jgi:hypothetical protein
MSIFKKYDSAKLRNLSPQIYKLYFPFNKPCVFDKTLHNILIERLDFYIMYINLDRIKYDNGNVYSSSILDWNSIKITITALLQD